MMKFLKFFPFIFFLCVGGISAGWVERVGTSGGEFLNLNFDARTVGMGNASSGFAFGVDSIKINPAGIAKMENQEISFSQVFWAEKVKFTAVSFAQPLGCGDFFIGFSLSGLWMDKIKKIDVYGNDAGKFSPYAFMTAYTFAGRIRRMKYGINTKIFYQDIAGESATGYSLDFGILFSAVKKFSFAFVLENMGAKLKFYRQKDPLPATAKAGIAIKFLRRAVFSFDYEIPSDYEKIYGFGLEGEIMRSFFLRCGFNSFLGITSGFGVKSGKLNFDYGATLRPGDIIENFQTISVKVLF